MHTTIKLGKKVHRILYYHERKVKEGVAECLYAGIMMKASQDLTFKEKQFFFQRLESLNERVARRTMSLILSWHQDDHPGREQMEKLGRDYMREMGLDRQPYLIYSHRDTMHPHIHIVTNRIRPDGSAIRNSLAMRVQSFQLTRKLERKYGLHQPGRRLTEKEWQAQHPVQVVRYGVTPLKPAISAVVEDVLPKYIYTSLDELNVLLRPYRVKATRGGEDSVTYRNKGLLYVPLNERGKMEEVYVKSSVLRMKPGLQYIERQMAENRLKMPAIQQRVETSVDWIFHQQRVNTEAFRKALRQDKIEMVMEGQKLYYVDRLNKAVLSGDRLGYKYSLEGLRERCLSEEEYLRQQQSQVQKRQLRQRPGMDL
jgi:hypothetical protein